MSSHFIRKWSVVCITQEVYGYSIGWKDFCDSIGSSFYTTILHSRVYEIFTPPINILLLQINITSLGIKQTTNQKCFISALGFFPL